MRLLVLGATGGVGRWFVRLAVGRRHEVTALVRASATFDAPSGVVVRTGDVTDAATLEEAVTGKDAVVSCLGLRRAGRVPWARLRSPSDLTARVTGMLTDAMRRQGVRRVVAISAAGVGDSVGRLTWPMRLLVSIGNVRVAYRDLAEMERALEGTDLDWLVVRPVTLSDGEPRRAAWPVTRYGLFSVVRRSEVAQWMLIAVEQPGPFHERKVMLGR